MQICPTCLPQIYVIIIQPSETCNAKNPEYTTDELGRVLAVVKVTSPQVNGKM